MAIKWQQPTTERGHEIQVQQGYTAVCINCKQQFKLTVESVMELGGEAGVFVDVDVNNDCPSAPSVEKIDELVKQQ